MSSISGCDGTLINGDRYTVSDVQADCSITARFELDVYTVSGRLSATALNQFDNTLNDGTTILGNNSTFGPVRQ